MTTQGDPAPEPTGGVSRLRTLCGLALTQMIGWGTTFYPIAIIGRAVEHDLGASRELVYAGLTVMLTVSALIAPRIGRRLDREGARFIMMAGSLLSGAGLAVVALAPDLVTYLLGWVLLGLMMPMALTLSAFTAITQVMGAGTRRAITLMTFFTGLASTIFWPLMQVLMPLLGWRLMLLVFAAAQFLICLPIHWWVLPSPAAHRHRLTMTNSLAEQPGILGPAKRFPALILAAAATSLHGIVGWGLALHFIEMFKSLGLAETVAVTIASLNGIMQVSARLADFVSGSRHSPLVIGVIAVTLQPLAFIAILAIGATPVTAFLFILGYGISAGLMTIVRVTLPLHLFGRAVYGTYAGRLTLPQNIVFGIAPVIFAAILDQGGPVFALWTALATSLGGVIAMLALSHYTRAPPLGQT